MIKLGIIGYPLGHSLSPVMHRAALEYLGLEGDYALIETMPENICDTIKSLRNQNLQGFNVTIPLKVIVIPFLDRIDNLAIIAGAVNTVVRQNNMLIGYNTDIYGFTQAIPQKERENLKSKKAAVFGTGGAARAVAVGLAESGIKEIVFYARDVKKADSLRQIISSNLTQVKVTVKQFSEYIDLSYASIAVNTTPLGMYGLNRNISPVSQKSMDTLNGECIVYDLVYRPRMTKFLQQAKDRNLKIIEGIEMLVLQGSKSLSMWLDREVPVDIMREAALKNL